MYKQGRCVFCFSAYSEKGSPAIVKRIGECRDIEKETAEQTGARRTRVESMHTAQILTFRTWPNRPLLPLNTFYQLQQTSRSWRNGNLIFWGRLELRRSRGIHDLLRVRTTQCVGDRCYRCPSFQNIVDLDWQSAHNSKTRSWSPFSKEHHIGIGQKFGPGRRQGSTGQTAGDEATS